MTDNLCNCNPPSATLDFDGLFNRPLDCPRHHFRHERVHARGFLIIGAVATTVLLSLSSTVRADAFDPSQISGLQLWLDASQGVTTDGTTPATNGALVQQWNDLSGNGNNAIQTTDANKPNYTTDIFNGHPAIQFSGAQSLVTSSLLDSSFNTNFTFFLVQQHGDNNFEVTTSDTSGTWYSSIYYPELNDDGHAVLYYQNNNLGGPIQFGGGGAHNLEVESFRYDGSGRTLRIYGLDTSSKTVSTTGTLNLNGALTIGKLAAGGFNYTGDIAELLIYKAALTDAQMTQVEQYLAAKYGVTPGTLPKITFDGDSMTYGVCSTDGETYPKQTIDLLGGTGSWDTVNLGVSNMTVKQIVTDQISEGMYNSLRRANVAILLGGTNDLVTGAETATQTYDQIVEYAQARRARGLKVIVSTILPRGGAGTSTFEADRQTVNADLRANWHDFADALSDIASDSRIGGSGDQLNTTYYCGDQVHLTNAGYAIVAQYAANEINQVVPPLVTLTTSNNPATYGDSLTLTATIFPSTATGTLTFKDGSTSIGTTTVSNGSGSFSLHALNAGTHLLTAVYGGNSTYLASTSSPVSMVVNHATTTTTLSTSANPSTYGNSITLTGIVSPTSATGTLTFKDGTTTIGFATMSHGSGSYITSSLVAGTHSITVVYSGNVDYLSSIASTLIQTVNAASASSSSASSSIGGAPAGRRGDVVGEAGGTRGISIIPNIPAAKSSNASYLASTSSTATNLTVQTGNTTVSFRDVSTSSWFAPYVTQLVTKGIVSGYQDKLGHPCGIFGPGNPVTYAEVAKMAILGAGLPPATDAPNNRSAQNQWSASYIAKAEELSLSPYTASINVNTPMTRAAALAAVLQAFQIPMTSYNTTYKDVSATTPYAAAIATATSLGIVQGDTDAAGKPTGTFRPTDPINRAEFSKILVQIIASSKSH